MSKQSEVKKRRPRVKLVKTLDLDQVASNFKVSRQVDGEGLRVKLRKSNTSELI